MQSIKGKSRFVISLMALISGIFIVGITPANASGYYPSGPQLNVPISNITSAGWTLCWSGLYDATDTLANIESSCTGKYLLEAGGAVGASSYILAAAGERSFVLKPTTLNETNLNNGVYWYYSKNEFGSMGFSPVSTIAQNSADCMYNGDVNCGYDSIYIEGQDPTANLRMSWHIDGTNTNGTIFGGWRLGHINWLNGGGLFGTVGVSGSGGDYIRAIYQLNAIPVASLDSLSFLDDGTGTGGKIVWAGKNIDAVLYTGPANSYPGPYNYGAFTGGWNGRIRNLVPGTSYTVSIYAISEYGVGESKSLTFTTNASASVNSSTASALASLSGQVSNQLSKVSGWIDQNTFIEGEASSLKAMLNKFNEVKTSARSAYLKLPFSSVVKASAVSTTPAVCKVEEQLTVRSIASGTCTISYTVTGGSKAPATLTRDFVFTKFAK